jgi:hypothetical protein
MSDKIRTGDSSKSNPKKQAPSSDTEESGTPTVKKSSNALFWALLGGGALLLCGLPLCGGLVGAVLWLKPGENAPKGGLAGVKPDGKKADAVNVDGKKPDGVKEIDKKPEGGKEIGKKPDGDRKEIDNKAPPTDIGKAPWGSAPVADLDAEIALWDYGIRLPKGYDTLMNNARITAQSEAYVYRWRQKGGQHHMDVTKIRMAGIDPVVLYKQDPMKSGPKDLVQFEVYRGPQEVLINNLRGVRQWKWSGSLGIPDGAIVVSYRYEIEGWHYVFNATAIGKSREDAEKTASLMDVSMCTFHNR